jgi:hypothetical protein
MGLNGRKKAIAVFDEEKVFRRTEAVYNKLIRDKLFATKN